VIEGSRHALREQFHAYLIAWTTIVTESPEDRPLAGDFAPAHGAEMYQLRGKTWIVRVRVRLALVMRSLQSDGHSLESETR
jgi:hypothetical protein